MVMARKKVEKGKDIIDQLLDNINFKGLTQDEVVGKDGIIKQLTGRILQRTLDAEMTEHLGYEKNSNDGDNSNLRFARQQPERTYRKNHNVDVLPDLISRVTNAVLDEVREWQNRPLEKSYAIVYLDALRIKGREDGKSCLKSVYTALVVNFECQKEVLLWIAETE
jgi:transposase-like protein